MRASFYNAGQSNQNKFLNAPSDPEMKKLVEGIHEFLGNTLYILIGIHAIAGLWHQYVIKDDTLRRMLNKVTA
jgi:cytochrome b561